ncbi:MAG: hypothetical protein CM1200mP38_5730 [Dehalococcoidia bacterium]|nr:MAG: hypothetical protein CM1200mP38_5730 [Dehalococcoidia bacterium]
MLANTFRDRGIEDLVVVATDVGGAGRARETAGILNAPIAIMDKRRIGNDDTTATDNLIGNVTGKTAFIIDDEIRNWGYRSEHCRIGYGSRCKRCLLCSYTSCALW